MSELSTERKLSRRSFIKGVIASAAVASSTSFLFRSPGQVSAATAGAVERLITLNVNGQKRRVEVMPNETLAHVIRYKLGLTGTKIGCDRAECGNCTVMIDGNTYYSCSTLVHTVRGREVTTVEGIKSDTGGLHPVQQAFIDELGPQCGFCTPGQVVTAVAFLNQNPNPTREEARQALAGNLCRCGAYNNYLNGVMRVVQKNVTMQ
ncbi:MAG: (2Fe-2S)-binding protein [Deltaproteobacteria bacterium]|jgi:aerobic-type carbon monoxide dehydrogenase small subunit (CoxS/CutS family)